MDAEALGNCIGPLSNAFLSRLPHHVSPCVNLHRVVPGQDELNDIAYLMEKPFPYSSTVPAPLIPLVPASRKVLNGHDSTQILVKKKIKWKIKKERLVQAVRKDKKNISGKAIKMAVRVPEGGKAVVPRGVALLAQHLDNDPDPSFSGVYNWYYTGGRLATLAHQDNRYLLHGNKSELSYTKIVNDDKADSCSVVQLSPGDPIYQVISNPKGGAVRQRMHVDILSMTNDSEDSFELTTMNSIKTKGHPFLSVALPPNSIEHFCTVTTNGVLKLWDTEYSRKRPKVKLRVEPGEGITVSDNWRTLLYLDNTLLMADRCCLHMLDVRSRLKEGQMAWCPQKLTEHCEEMSCIVCSQVNDHTVYALTTHQAFTLDLRFGFTQRWTHMMASPPLYGFTHTVDNEHTEVLCVGSQALSDCVTMMNSWSGEESHSPWRPASLPSPALGLHLARVNGTCLHPSLKERCTQSMTGLTCLPAEEGLYVVRQSSTADVFIQHLSSQSVNPKQLTEKGLAAYTDWSEPALSLQRDPVDLAVPQVKDFSDLFKALTSKSVPEEREPTARVVQSGKWKMSKKYLEDCVDMLAARMLAVWDVEDEDEWEEAKEPDDNEQDPSEKVLNWLGSGQQTVRDITEISPLKPMVTSTPFPKASCSQSAPTQDRVVAQPVPPLLDTLVSAKGLKTPAKKKKPNYGHLLSSSSSEGSPERRKHKMINKSSAATPAVSKPLTASAKKKFIPGF